MLSNNAKRRLVVALTSEEAGLEVANSIDGIDNNISIVDQSVNNGSAKVDNIGQLIVRTQQITNTAGNFNGGGTGNKVLGGFAGFNNVLLKNFPSISYDFYSVDALHANSGAYCYFNALMDLNGNGSDVRVIVFCFNNASPSLITCTRVVNVDGTISISFNKSVNTVMSVGATIAGVAPVVGTDLDPFTARRYLLPDIAAVYPNARLIDAVHTDGGLPKYVKCKALMFTLSDSSTNAQLYAEVYNLKINGVSALFKSS